MSCPYYKDFTRECIDKFKAIAKFVTFDVCEAEDEYNDCIIYKAIIENKLICPEIDKCTEDYKKISIKIILKLMKNENILKIIDLDEYCFSNNYVNCIRYKHFIKGEKVPSSLRPDGSKRELKEFLIKKFE